MNIKFICAGKNSEKPLRELLRKYSERIEHYCRFHVLETESGKGDEMQIAKKEGKSILKLLAQQDFVILLDRMGKEVSSMEFAGLLQHHRNISTKTLVFITGGAYGFSAEVNKRANQKISLSKMTFPHQLVRVIFLEQLYRAFTILSGEKYHH